MKKILCYYIWYVWNVELVMKYGWWYYYDRPILPYIDFEIRKPNK